VEAKATDSPVKLRISSLCARKHNVKHKESQKNSENSYKFQERCCGNVAVFLLSYRLYKACDHHTKAEEITDVCEMNVEVPTDRVDVVKDTQGSYRSYKTKRTIDGLKNKLCGSVFNHCLFPFLMNIF
jgi:hypothetical protein